MVDKTKPSRVEVPAGALEYVDEGSGPPVVLLHGLLMDHTVWDDVIPLLPKGFHYIRPVCRSGRTASRCARAPI
ncbi:putative hydrolase [Gordonia paraffinivorans NBRC 108238]|uniref:Hydrolase n=1 Tax=Gordonia paraffinivorans NBRC 108238 TaxID=1223543 RepID=A0ABQ0IIF5_9ACTN|nr:putative hydrolase [Gordonia paraffinivorans NBRC 108238]